MTAEPQALSLRPKSTKPSAAAPARRLYPTYPSCFHVPAEIRNAIYDRHFPPGKATAQLLARRNGGYIQMSDRLNLITTCR